MTHHSFEHWTMTKLPDGRRREKNFVTLSATADEWRYEDRTNKSFPLPPIVTLRSGMQLNINPAEKEELMGFPTVIEILRFEVKPKEIGYLGGVVAVVKPLAYEPQFNGAGNGQLVINSETLRAAYTGGTLALQPNFEGRPLVPTASADKKTWALS